MAEYTIEIDGATYRIPDDLDLNDAVEAEKLGDDLGNIAAVRFAVWRLLLRTNPEITLEEAGAKVPFSSLLDEAEEEGPPEIPLSEPEAQSGTSSDAGSGNGSTGTRASFETTGISGPQQWESSSA